MAFQSTTGIGTPAQIAVDAVSVTLSLGGTATHQIVSSVQDVLGHIVSQVTLSAAGTAAAGSTVYTGTVTNGAANALVGFTFVVAGFVTAANNGVFVCTASTTTTLTLSNAAGVAETHAGTATPQGFVPATVLTYVSYQASAATVSASGLITAVAKGHTTVEVSYPAFSNTAGNVAVAGNVMNGLPLVKVFKEVDVFVTA